MEEVLTIVEFVINVISEHRQESALTGGAIVGLVFVSWLISKIPWWVWMLVKLLPIVYGLYWLQSTYNNSYPHLLEWLSPEGQKVGQKVVLGLMGPVYYFAILKVGVPIIRRSWWRRHEPKTSTEVWIGANLIRGTFGLACGTARLALGKRRKPRQVKQTA